MAALGFLGRRLAVIAVVLLVVSFLIFALLDLAPGSPLAALIGNHPAPPEVVAALKAKYHLDDPFLVQYGHWLVSALHGDFGRSTESGDPVSSLIAQRWVVTLQLSGYAVAMALVVGVPLGFLAGSRYGGPLDRLVSGASIVAMSAPAFALGILLLYVFGVQLSWFPVYGAGSGLLQRLWHLTLPAVALAAGILALVLRQTRASLHDVLSQDYITFARSRGISSRRVTWAYALRNASLPIVTALGLLAIFTISGTVLVETVFSLQGVGQLLVESIQSKDVPVAQGIALEVAAAVVLINLVVDGLILWLDPRARAKARG